MKKTRRLLASVLALMLCAAVALTALAEGKLKTLYQAGTRLLFNTDNVSLKAHAEFAYNGYQFKTVDAVYTQDGVDSLMDIKLKTPRQDGSVQDSGFTVVANDGIAYSIEPVDNPYVYMTSSCQPSDSVISNTVLRRTMTRLGGALVSALEGTFADKIQVSGQADGSRDYRILLKAGDTPEVFNQSATLLAMLAAQRYFYRDYDWEYLTKDAREPVEENGYLEISYDDYDATFAQYYMRLFNEKMPEDFYETIWGGEEGVNEAAYEKYQQVSDALNEQIVQPLQESYSSGAALIHADGSFNYFESYDEYLVACHLQQVDYTDPDGAFISFYRQQTGAELTRADLEAIRSSNNEALWNAYSEMYDQMDQQYRKLVEEDGKASLIQVNAEGGYRMIYDIMKYYNAHTLGYGVTVTQQILYELDQLAIGDTDVTLTLDAQDRITSAQGSVTVLVLDEHGQSNDLQITFELTADRYGESKVETFDPAAFGIMTYEEFNKSGLPLPSKQHTSELPETVTFEGIPYQVTVEMSETDK